MQDYEVSNLIGKGSYGAVYKAKRKIDGLDVVIKQVSGIGRGRARAESQVLADLAHPTIVKYYETFEGQSEKTLHLVMEYCDGGDLRDLIQTSKTQCFNRRRPGLPESTVLDYLAQMALALHYMHSQNIMHRDLKSPNIFLQDGGRRIKVGDFGVSTFLETSMDFAETCIGTPFYMSPELFKNNPYNFKSDIWALGCITYEILTGNHAFHSESLSALSDRVVKGKYNIPRNGSPNLLQLLKRMLSVNPNKRPTAAHILKSPLLNRPLRCFLDRYLSTVNWVEQKGEVDSLIKQLGTLGLEDMIVVNRMDFCPQELILYKPETSAATLATDTIKEIHDDVFIENLEHGQSEYEEVPVPSEDKNVVEATVEVLNNLTEDCTWSSVPPYDSVESSSEEILPGNISMRRSLLERQCIAILGRDKFERCFNLIATEASEEQRPVLKSSCELSRVLEDDLGPGWKQACRLVEQILWIDANTL